MKILKYFLQYHKKVIGIFTSREACLEQYMRLIQGKDPYAILEYQIVEFPIDENDNTIYNLLDLE